MFWGKANCPEGWQYLSIITVGPNLVPRLAGPIISLYQLTNIQSWSYSWQLTHTNQISETEALTRMPINCLELGT